VKHANQQPIPDPIRALSSSFAAHRLRTPAKNKRRQPCSYRLRVKS
jgi:hypothetical protein